MRLFYGNRTVIRKLDWRDLALLARVRDRGLCPDAQLAFTRGANAMQHALLNPFIPGKTAITLVARNEDIDAIGQFTLRSNRSNARLTFIGPVDVLDHDSGLELVESLAYSAGEHGAHNLVADIDEESPAFEKLRQAGFAIYARQRIWALNQELDRQAAPAPETWRPEAQGDMDLTQNLYLDIVPGLVRQVEPPPARLGRNLVHMRAGELLGYLDIERGARGIWVQPFFHPAAEDFDQLLSSYLSQAPADRPVHVCVRSYQSWMGGPLERLGFEPAADQAVMVKRLAIAVRRTTTSPLPAVEGTYPEPTAPIAHFEEPAAL